MGRWTSGSPIPGPRPNSLAGEDRSTMAHHIKEWEIEEKGDEGGWWLAAWGGHVQRGWCSVDLVPPLLWRPPPQVFQVKCGEEQCTRIQWMEWCCYWAGIIFCVVSPSLKFLASPPLLSLIGCAIRFSVGHPVVGVGALFCKLTAPSGTRNHLRPCKGRHCHCRLICPFQMPWSPLLYRDLLICCRWL